MYTNSETLEMEVSRLIKDLGPRSLRLIYDESCPLADLHL